MRSIILVGIAAALGGCQPEARETMGAQGKDALNYSGKALRAAGEMVGTGLRSALQGSGKVDEKSPRADILAAREKAKQAEASAQGQEKEVWQKEVDRLSAALGAQDLRAELDQRVAEAMKAKENAQKTAEDVRAQLMAADAKYQEMQKQFQDAQAKYQQAKDSVNGFVQRLEGGP